MPTCSYCGHDVGPNAQSCPNCGEGGENWKEYSGPSVYSDPKYAERDRKRMRTEAAWSDLFSPLLWLFVAGFFYVLVRLGLPVVVGIAAFLFSSLGKVKWDAVNTVSVVAAWIASISTLIYAVKENKSEIDKYLKELPENAALVVVSIAKVAAVILALYLLFLLGGKLFLQ